MVSALSGCGDLARDFIFSPEKAKIVSTDWTDIPAKTVHYKTDDGLKLQGWYWPGNKPGHPLIIHLHGTSGHMGIATLYMNELIEAGYPVFIPEYRGYGPNPGFPSSEGLMKDGDGIHKYAEKLANANHGGQSVLLAHSLGSGVAIDMASKYNYYGLILISPFTSIKDAAPDWAMNFIKDEFDNLGKMQDVDEPLMVLHGVQDRVVKFDLGMQLFLAARQSAAFIKIENAGHRPAPKHLIAFSLDAIADFRRDRSFSRLRRRAATLPNIDVLTR